MSRKTEIQATEKKIVFSKEIDSLINGLTLGFAFIVVGLFLLFVPDYFGNKLVGKIVRWIFIVIGTLGLYLEVRKLKPISNIKGFDDLWSSTIFLGVWAALYFLFHDPLWNILGFFCMMFGTYGAFLGLFRIMYSIHLNRKNKVKAKGTIISDIVIFLTKVFSLVLVILQVVNVVNE